MLFYKVRAVPGRQVFDLVGSSGGAKRIVGHKPVQDGTRMSMRDTKPVPHTSWQHTNEVVRIAEHQAYLRRHILDGGLDYVGSVDVSADGTEKALPMSAELVAATAKNVADRAAAAASASDAEALHDDPAAAAALQALADAKAAADKAVADAAAKKLAADRDAAMKKAADDAAKAFDAKNAAPVTPLAKPSPTPAPSTPPPPVAV